MSDDTEKMVWVDTSETEPHPVESTPAQESEQSSNTSSSPDTSMKSNEVEQSRERASNQKAKNSTPIERPQSNDRISHVSRAGAFEGKVGTTHDSGTKLGIVGGVGVGKSYLFRALVYQLQQIDKSGPLSYFLNDAVTLYEASEDKSQWILSDTLKFTQPYETWVKLSPTRDITQKWYRLSIPIRSGVLNRTKREINLEFFDGAGEHLASTNETGKNTWANHYEDTDVMVFCLPFWAAFPKPVQEMNQDEYDSLNKAIESFRVVVNNFLGLRRSKSSKSKVKCIIALTMADDILRSPIAEELSNTWFRPFKLVLGQTPQNLGSYFKRVSKGSGVSLYLANAKRVSDILISQMESNRSLTDILNKLDLGEGRPWILPVSAIDGDLLDSEDTQKLDVDDLRRRHLPAPIPAHIELLLLVTLSQHTNALM